MRLQIAAFLTPPTLSALRDIAPALAGAGQPDIYPAASVDQLRDPDVLLLDTEYSHTPVVRARLDAYARPRPHVAYVVVGRVSRQLAADVASAAGSGLSAVILRDFDSPMMMVGTVRDAYLRALPARLVWALSAVLGRMPVHTARAVRSALSGAISAKRVADVAALAKVTTRTFYRHLVDAGVPEPRELHRVARVMSVLPMIYQRGIKLEEVAVRGGDYHAYGQFQTHVREVLGWSPRDLRYHVPVGDLLPQLVRRIAPEGWGSEKVGAVVDADPISLLRAG